MEGKKPLWTEGALREGNGKRRLAGPGGRGVYWLPGGGPLKRGLVTPSGVEKNGVSRWEGFFSWDFLPRTRPSPITAGAAGPCSLS